MSRVTQCSGNCLVISYPGFLNHENDLVSYVIVVTGRSHILHLSDFGMSKAFDRDLIEMLFSFSFCYHGLVIHFLAS